MATIAHIVLLSMVASVLGQQTVVTTIEPSTSTSAGDLQPERECTSAGAICATCSEVAVCVGTGSGAFEKLRQTCHAGEKCVNGTCVEGAVCNYRAFQCSDEGYYPDPFDCQEYHVCLPEGGSFATLSFKCQGLTAYDATTQDCSVSRLTSAACLDRPVPECLSRLQIGPISGDSSLYYICIEKENTIAPELRRCPAGRTFDVKTVSCVDATVSEKKKDKKKKSKSS